MARAFSYLRRGEDKLLKILVATSGDTGGAVAEGFFGMEGISVTVLYPKGKVTPLQEKQIAGLVGNVSAIAVEGSFDDCQRLVKEAFGDEELKTKFNLSSANSINISRLIPQAVYYSSGAGEALREKKPALMCVPSGNFGNLTAGLYAWKMGTPISLFVAATNINKTVPDFLESGFYETRPSQVTLSNAMDVGAPSNFERMMAHFSWGEMRKLILGSSVTDEETCQTIQEVFTNCAYCLDPHSAVGWKAVDKLSQVRVIPGADSLSPVILSTAHPAKFSETVEPLVGAVPLPPSLLNVDKRTVSSVTIPAELERLKVCL
jgi:threonine synthase